MIAMRYGTAKVGMRVRIVDNHNNHGFEPGEVVKLIGNWGKMTDWGYGFIARRTNEVHPQDWIVREIDFKPVGGKVV